MQKLFEALLIFFSVETKFLLLNHMPDGKTPLEILRLCINLKAAWSTIHMSARKNTDARYLLWSQQGVTQHIICVAFKNLFHIEQFDTALCYHVS